ncbi:MAG: hypothetical protein CMO01_15250 [Thalassobius sp.]|nr:hypothetical protein [Thalassovita sp.]
MNKLSEIIEKLNYLKSIDKSLDVFGAKSHKYQLKPPTAVKTVSQIEQLYNFALPEDYKEFITKIGDGGAGYGYRMLGFDVEDAYRVETPFKGVDKILKYYVSKEWEEDRKLLLKHYSERLKDHFSESLSKVSTLDLFLKSEELGLDLSHYYNLYEDGRFPESWEADKKILLATKKQELIKYLDDEVLSRAHTRFLYKICDVHQIDLSNLSLKMYSRYELINPQENYKDVYIETNHNEFTGYIPLFEEGCGHISVLIVNGEDYGEVVHFGNDAQLSATNKSFSDFYIQWLDNSISKVEKSIKSS